MCCRLEVSFRPVLETVVTQNSRHPTAYFICQFAFFPHIHMTFPTPKLDFKIPEGRTYLSFLFRLVPNIVASKLWGPPCLEMDECLSDNGSKREPHSYHGILFLLCQLSQRKWVQ